MSNKAKGSRVERELLKLFTERGWRAARVAGSGTNENTFCDLIAGKYREIPAHELIEGASANRAVAVEVKSSKDDRIYIKRAQIEEFMKFSEIFGLEPVIAVRFNREGWIFMHPEEMEDTGGNWVVSLKRAKIKGKKFGQFFD